MKTKYRIGIDPDLTKSGVAIISHAPFQKQKIEELLNCRFFEVLSKIEEFTKKGEVRVMLEAGWLNKKSNYHSAPNQEVAGRIGKNVGENHAVGKLIEEWCMVNQVPYSLIKPTNKKWDSKLFKMITNWDKRTNAEQRDAVRAAWL